MTIFKHNQGCHGQWTRLNKSGYEFECWGCGNRVSVMHTDSLNEDDKKIFEELILCKN